MSDSERRLPANPNVIQLRKQAAELQAVLGLPNRSAALFELAKSYGFESWPKLKLHVDRLKVRKAIIEGDTEGLRKIIEKTPRLARVPLDDGSMPLHLAAENNDPAMVEMLVKAGAAMGPVYPPSAHTALSWALTCWSFHAAVKLVELGAKPDLFCAAGLGSLALVQSFWQDGELISNASTTGSSRYDELGTRLPCPPETADDMISDALYIACRTGRLEVGRWLLEHGADPNFRGFAGATCLAWAECSGNQDLADLLRQYGGSDELIDREFGVRPRELGVMITAVWGFPIALLRSRLERNPALAKATGTKGTVLHLAAKAGNLEAVKVLLEFGADPYALDPDGKSVIEVAHERIREDLRSLLT